MLISSGTYLFILNTEAV